MIRNDSLELSVNGLLFKHYNNFPVSLLTWKNPLKQFLREDPYTLDCY